MISALKKLKNPAVLCIFLTAVVVRRDGAAGAEEQTPAESRAKPEFPAPSALQQPTQPPLPSARRSLLYEAPLPSWTLWTLPLSGPLHWLLSQGHPSITFPH